MEQKLANLNALLNSLGQAYQQLHYGEQQVEVPANKPPKVPLELERHEDEDEEGEHELHSNQDEDLEEDQGYPYHIDEYSEESERLCSEQLEALDLMRLDEIEGKEETGEPCSICLLPLQDFPEEIRILPCEHLFHRSCVDYWLKEKARCPKCKFDIREYL